MSLGAISSYRVEAFNTALASENRIHDDVTARRFGFNGGLVPGVEVYAYMAHVPVAAYSRAWLERGGLECRFLKPVYDGRIAIVSARRQEDGLELGVESDGVHCAVGRAWLAAAPGEAPSLEPQAPAPPAERPPASVESLVHGRVLGIHPQLIDEDRLCSYLADIRETEALYLGEQLVHPGLILRLANAALTQNVVLGPWIHVGSEVQNFAAARIGDRLTLSSRVTSNREHKGHAIVELEALAMAEGKPISAIRHTAIWRPRQLAEPA